MRLVLAIVFMLLGGCKVTQNPTTPLEPQQEPFESIAIQEEPVLQFAPLSTLVEWHSDSCKHNKGEFLDNYIAQRKIQMFFESLCKTKGSESRLAQLTTLVGLNNWPRDYQIYFSLIEQREKQAHVLNVQLAQLQKEAAKLKVTLSERNLELSNLKSQLAEIQKQKLDAAVTPLSIDRE